MLLANGHRAKVHSNVPLSQIDERRPWRSALVVIVGGARGSRGGGAEVSITTTIVLVVLVVVAVARRARRYRGLWLWCR
jgi:hypothetical protein